MQFETGEINENDVARVLAFCLLHVVNSLLAMRRADYLVRRQRLEAAIRKNPDCKASDLAERFGVNVGTVLKIAKAIGIKLPAHDGLSKRHLVKATYLRPGKRNSWGNTGYV